MEGVNDCCRIRRAAVLWQRLSLWILRVETLYRSELALSRRDCTKATAMDVAMSVVRVDLLWRKLGGESVHSCRLHMSKSSYLICSG